MEDQYSQYNDFSVGQSQTKYRLKGSNYYMDSREKRTFELILMFIVFFIIIVSIVVLLKSFTSISKREREDDSNYETHFNDDFEDTDVGGSRDGVVKLSNGSNILGHTNVNYNYETGECHKPYYGSRCHLEAWDDNFYAFGDTPMSNIENIDGSEYNIIVPTKSWHGDHYSEDSCSAKSMADETSIGFWHFPGQCVLLNNYKGNRMEILDITKVRYAPSEQIYMYLKKGFMPKVDGMVSFGAKGGKFLRNYLPRENTKSYASIDEMGVVKTIVDFKPYNVFNPNGYVGIWSSKPFDSSDFNTMVQNQISDDYKVDVVKNTANYIFTLPKNISDYNVLYVMYTYYTA
jgi:hypothetical protein